MFFEDVFIILLILNLILGLSIFVLEIINKIKTQNKQRKLSDLSNINVIEINGEIYMTFNDVKNLLDNLKD